MYDKMHECLSHVCHQIFNCLMVFPIRNWSHGGFVGQLIMLHNAKQYMGTFSVNYVHCLLMLCSVSGHLEFVHSKSPSSRPRVHVPGKRNICQATGNLWGLSVEP